jgi:hypothetical protein
VTDVCPVALRHEGPVDLVTATGSSLLVVSASCAAAPPPPAQGFQTAVHALTR